MTGLDSTVPPPLADLLAGVGRAFEGDADAIEEVVTDDVVWVDDGERLDGVAAVLTHFLAHGGWREVFSLRHIRPSGPSGDGSGPAPGRTPEPIPGVDSSGDGTWEVAWTLWLRADSTSYRREGLARLEVVDGLIARWESTATEHEDGSLAAWGGD